MEGLGISLPTLITQVVTFIILLVVLRLVAYKPIMRMLDERSRRIKESMEQAETLKAETAKGEEVLKQQMEQASREGQERIDRAVRVGEEIRVRAEDEAKRETEKIIARARAEIRRERAAAVNDVRKEFADLTVLAAGKVIEKSLDKDQHRELIDKVLEENITPNV